MFSSFDCFLLLKCYWFFYTCLHILLLTWRSNPTHCSGTAHWHWHHIFANKTKVKKLEDQHGKKKCCMWAGQHLLRICCWTVNLALPLCCGCVSVSGWQRSGLVCCITWNTQWMTSWHHFFSWSLGWWPQPIICLHPTPSSASSSLTSTSVMSSFTTYINHLFFLPLRLLDASFHFSISLLIYSHIFTVPPLGISKPSQSLSPKHLTHSVPLMDSSLILITLIQREAHHFSAQ